MVQNYFTAMQIWQILFYTFKSSVCGMKSLTLCKLLWIILGISHGTSITELFIHYFSLNLQKAVKLEANVVSKCF